MKSNSTQESAKQKASGGGCPGPLSVQKGLEDYAAAVKGVLGSDLVGIYVYGSVANGCYHSETSDVDVVVILAKAIAQESKEALLRIHQARSIPIDGTYITREEVNEDVHPTALQCVIRANTLYGVPDGLIDFLIIRDDLYSNGQCLFGPEVRSVVRPVPWSVLRPCLEEMFAVALERFKNPVLMLCRIVCSLRTREACSKVQAAEWGLAHFDQKWHGLIEQALREYRGGIAVYDFSREVGEEFEQYCREQAETRVSGV